LGDLWGLILAKAEFESEKELVEFELPKFSVLEVTNDEFFSGGNLVGKSFAEVQNEFKKISESQNEIETRNLEVED
jgi:CYTH domain-containing protein